MIIYIFNMRQYRVIFRCRSLPKGWSILMRAVVTVIGKDTVGILTKVSGICTEYNANVMEVTQSVLQDMFAMIMMVDISRLNRDFTELVTRMTELGKELALDIHIMHEEIFDTMHKI